MDASGMLPGHIACFLFPCESPAIYPSIQKCRELRLERRAANDACLVPDRPGVTPCAWHSPLRSFYEAGLVLNHFLEAADLWLLHHHTSLLADTAACPRAPLFFCWTAPWFSLSRIASATSDYLSLPCTSTCSTTYPWFLCSIVALLY